MSSARALLTIALVAAAAVAFTSSPAAAHTSLRESDPAANGTVATLPEFVRLTFTTQLPSVPTIEVVDANGVSVNSSPVSLRGNTALQPVKSASAGRYTVNWKAKAPDGHEISGTFAFTATAGNIQPTTPAPETTGPSPTQAAAAPTDGDGPWWPWLAAGLLIAALLAVFWYARRRRSSPA